MKCELVRDRTMPTVRKGEKAWSCNRCGALAFSDRKPSCREVTLDEVRARDLQPPKVKP